MLPITIIRSTRIPTISDSLQKDIIIIGDKIFDITKPNDFFYSNLSIREIDGSKLIALPGLVDPHVHILGGGGASGYESFVEGCSAKDLWENGITSVVGCLGFDSTSKSLISLVRKTKSLSSEGIGAYCLVGGFNFPALTITGNIRSDMLTILEVVGGGELALGDFRGSFMSDEQLATYAVECFTGGMLSGKAGILQVHLGQDAEILSKLRRVSKKFLVPLSVFHVLHINRNKEIFEASAEFAKAGGYIDITTHLPGDGTISPKESVLRLINMGVPEEHITLSTDGFSGIAICRGDNKTYIPSPVDGLLDTAIELVKENISINSVWKFVSKNAAIIYALSGRGSFNSADILLFDLELGNLKGVILSGIYHNLKEE